jgi:hypothetical protein
MPPKRGDLTPKVANTVPAPYGLKWNRHETFLFLRNDDGYVRCDLTGPCEPCGRRMQVVMVR